MPVRRVPFHFPGLARQATPAGIKFKKMSNNPNQVDLETLRHSCAHLMAQSVQELFPGTQVTIGPVIEDGFYYDFSRDKAFVPEDLEKIEKRMKEIAAQDLQIVRTEISRDEAIKKFTDMGEKFKVEIIDSVEEPISVYSQGDWSDLCRGPHVESTKQIKAFNLLHTSSACWRGDERNPVLQRIYGTAWNTEKELRVHLKRLEEAKKRDHRKLGVQLDLFHLQEEAPGAVFWHPKGWALYQIVTGYIRELLGKNGYQEIGVRGFPGRGELSVQRMLLHPFRAKTG